MISASSLMARRWKSRMKDDLLVNRAAKVGVQLSGIVGRLLAGEQRIAGIEDFIAVIDGSLAVVIIRSGPGQDFDASEARARRIRRKTDSN